MKVLYGKEFAAKIKADAKKRAEILKDKYHVTPGLAVVIVGNDPASEVYVRNKHRACAELGINSIAVELPETTTREELLAKIDALNDNPDVHGILVQLPLPNKLKGIEAEVTERIDPKKDVDGFHPINTGRLVNGEDGMVPCTPLGCMKMLEMAGIDPDGKRAVVIGRSNIVGKPMASLLMRHNATVTVCHSHTKNISEITKEADILVAAIGKPKAITADMVKPGAVVIDVGINRIAPKKLVGDVDFEKVSKIASAITPVPGGVGLLTIATLMHNTIKAAELACTSK